MKTYSQTYSILQLLLASLVLMAGVFTLAHTAERPKGRPLDVNPKHFSKDPSVKLDYDIVYVRAPRFVKSNDGKQRPAPVWPEIGHPFNLRASTDLMVLHPDGSEDLLVEGGARAQSPILMFPSMPSGSTTPISMISVVRAGLTSTKSMSRTARWSA